MWGEIEWTAKTLTANAAVAALQPFLDEVADSGLVSTLTVHDAQGRLYHDPFVVPSPPDAVAQVLSTGDAMSRTHGEGERFVHGLR